MVLREARNHWATVDDERIEDGGTGYIVETFSSFALKPTLMLFHFPAAVLSWEVLARLSFILSRPPFLAVWLARAGRFPFPSLLLDHSAAAAKRCRRLINSYSTSYEAINS